ncbi:CU044_2847 family protein [cf. Phormidesmis sp. LEGE 11477]|uniref:CU044_2847 family protein n=1 Tax=cf. Phormidesmis sp. LEGE 11477 TaxID=1828680 RepID=UPI00187F2EDB|nr:CU044_2847 family protein [cf. Phormidesmis sp. LEGE 11477]MBE9064656.1 hypothetical protein [cf. Phormidesmis sp. LEGE 11477]
MTQLVPVQLEDGSEIYIEAETGTELSLASKDTKVEDSESEEMIRGNKKGLPEFVSRGFNNLPGAPMENEPKTAAAIAAQSFKAIEGTIRTYTSQTLNSFKNMGNSDIHKVTLEFGIQVGGEAGVPYVTKGTAGSNLSIKVECVFDSEK